MVRSTEAQFEPRYRAMKEILASLELPIHEITWDRATLKAETNGNQDADTFHYKSAYGKGLRNIWSHAHFFLHIRKRLRKINPLLVYACDFDTLLPTLLLRNSTRKVVYDQYDPISARFGANEIVLRLLDLFESLIAMGADLRISANKLRIPKLLRNRFVEVKNLFKLETAHYEREEVNPDRPPTGGKTLFYGGVLAKDRGLLSVAHTMHKAQDWNLVIVGMGPELDDLSQVKQANVNLFGFLPHADLIKTASNADLILVLYDPKKRNNRLTASNKLFEACQLGIPVIASKGTWVGDCVLQNNLGWAIDFGNHDALLNVLAEFNLMSSADIEGIKRNMDEFIRANWLEQQQNLEILESEIRNLLLHE